MLKRIIIVLIVMTIPLFLFLNAWQSFRYNDLYGEVKELERRQEELMEKNKALIVSIEIYKSPKRIDRLASGELGLHVASPSETMKIKGRSEIR